VLPAGQRRGRGSTAPGGVSWAGRGRGWQGLLWCQAGRTLTEHAVLKEIERGGGRGAARHDGVPAGAAHLGLLPWQTARPLSVARQRAWWPPRQRGVGAELGAGLLMGAGEGPREHDWPEP
jgi:hypothetical protein